MMRRDAVLPRKRKVNDGDSDIDDHERPKDGSITAETLLSMTDCSDELCVSCKGIDFDNISRLKIKSDLGLYVKHLDPIEILQASSCPLCRLFGISSPSPVAHHGSASTASKSLHLRAFSSNFAFARLTPDELQSQGGDTMLLGVVDVTPTEANGGRHDAGSRLRSSLKETGYLCLFQAGKQSAAISINALRSDRINVDIARYWLGYCRKNHTKTCGKACMMPVKSLRVIDCATRSFVDAPVGCQYVALSYVWGQAPPDEAKSRYVGLKEGILPTFPKTIEDSIQVTKDLSMRYLWVDRYCIDQSDPKDKHQQIKQMDLIYSTAELTLIAAAGEDASHGLPGVGGTRRTEQKTLRIGKHGVIQTLAHPSYLLRKARWASRGWTYQEGILSRRRLLFTPQQVLYECSGMHCAESMILPLDAMHSKRRDKFKTSVPSGAFEVKLPGSYPFDIFRYVSEYYQRQLSYSEDALNAFRGVSQMFEKGAYAVYNLSGIPVLPPCVETSRNTQPQSCNRSATEAFLMGLYWYHAEGGERREQFPSWSWAGWSGGKLVDGLYNRHVFKRLNLNGLIRCYGEPKVWIERPNSPQMPFPEYDNLADYLSSIDYYTRFIHIEAWTVPCFIVNVKPRSWWSRFTQHPSERAGFYAKIPLTNTCFGFFEACLNMNALAGDFERSGFEHKTYTAVLLPYFDSSIFYHQNTHILIVEDHGDYHERIGCSFIEFDAFQRYYEIHEMAQSDDLTDVWDTDKIEIFKNWFGAMPKVKRRIRLG